jgi:hypothetical protein
MWKYNLYTHKPEGNTAFPGLQRPANDPLDAIQQAGDAVVYVFPYKDADTFNFESQGANDLTVVKGKNKKGETTSYIATPDIKLAENPVVLDTWLTQLSVTQSKENHQGSLSALLLDPDDSILSKISPGDLIVCWMLDNHKDGKVIREKLARGDFTGLNGFSSGLKFIGKVFSVRKNLDVTQAGAKQRRISVLATSFSELDSNIYFDPQLSTNFSNGLQFMASISSQLSTMIAMPDEISKMLASYLTVFMGVGLKTSGANASAQMSRPLKVPDVVGKILQKSNAPNYIDTLSTIIGIQEFGTSYMPEGVGDQTTSPGVGTDKSFGAQGKVKTTSNSPHPSIQYTPKGLVGWTNSLVQPFNNIPMWGILQQTLNPVANEMYTTLRMDNNGNINPTLVMRQIPFNTEAFAKSNQFNIQATAFKSLPRWVISDEMITSLSVGKSESLRVNFVRIHANAWINSEITNLLGRGLVPPRSDIVDIERNGLRAYLATINSTLGGQVIYSTKAWTAMVTDRVMGSHLKYSGTVGLAGSQEPIAVGDNLEYDNLVFHIEQVTHSLNVDGNSGRKSFSTTLAISNGVPVTDAVLPGIVNRNVLSNPNPITYPGLATRSDISTNLSNKVATNTKKDDT